MTKLIRLVSCPPWLVTGGGGGLGDVTTSPEGVTTVGLLLAALTWMAAAATAAGPWTPFWKAWSWSSKQVLPLTKVFVCPSLKSNPVVFKFFGFWLEFLSEFGLSFEFLHQNALEVFFSVYVSTKAFKKSDQDLDGSTSNCTNRRYLTSVLLFRLIGETLNIE